MANMRQVQDKTGAGAQAPLPKQEIKTMFKTIIDNARDVAGYALDILDVTVIKHRRYGYCKFSSRLFSEAESTFVSRLMEPVMNRIIGWTNEQPAPVVIDGMYVVYPADDLMAVAAALVGREEDLWEEGEHEPDECRIPTDCWQHSFDGEDYVDGPRLEVSDWHIDHTEGPFPGCSLCEVGS